MIAEFIFPNRPLRADQGEGVDELIKTCIIVFLINYHLHVHRIPYQNGPPPEIYEVIRIHLIILNLFSAGIIGQ